MILHDIPYTYIYIYICDIHIYSLLFTIISHNVNQNGPHQGSATGNGHVMGNIVPYIPYFITVKWP